MVCQANCILLALPYNEVHTNNWHHQMCFKLQNYLQVAVYTGTLKPYNILRYIIYLCNLMWTELNMDNTTFFSLFDSTLDDAYASANLNFRDERIWQQPRCGCAWFYSRAWHYRLALFLLVKVRLITDKLHNLRMLVARLVSQSTGLGDQIQHRDALALTLSCRFLPRYGTSCIPWTLHRGLRYPPLGTSSSHHQFR
jgi:hypothetical protein